jgi:uncharacterized membrane protein (DUF485 family)
VRGSLVAWLVVVSLAFSVGPTTSFLVFDQISFATGAISARVSGQTGIDEYVPLAVIVLAAALILLAVYRRRPRWDLALYLAVALGAAAVCRIPEDRLSDHLTTLFWQILLVVLGIVQAAAPLTTLTSRHGERSPCGDAQPVAPPR